MDKNYDYEKIRTDLISYYTFVAKSGHVVAYLDVLEIEKANNDELIELAIRNSVNLDNYIIKTKTR